MLSKSVPQASILISRSTTPGGHPMGTWNESLQIPPFSLILLECPDLVIVLSSFQSLALSPESPFSSISYTNSIVAKFQQFYFHNVSFTFMWTEGAYIFNFPENFPITLLLVNELGICRPGYVWCLWQTDTRSVAPQDPHFLVHPSLLRMGGIFDLWTAFTQ